MLKSPTAIGAGAAIRQRHDRNAISFCDAGDSRPDCQDIAGELVAEDLRVLRSSEGMRFDWRHDRTCDVLVQIGAADAAGDNPDNDLPFTRCRWLGDFLDSEVARLVEAKGPHA